MRCLLFSMDELHLHLSLEETENLVHRAHGHITKTSHRWGRSSYQPRNSRFSENTLRNSVSTTWAVQRLACEIAGSFRECGSPLRLLHALYCSCLWSNRTSLTWMKLCRGFPWLCSAVPCWLWRGQAARMSLLQQPGHGFALTYCLSKS